MLEYLIKALHYNTSTLKMCKTNLISGLIEVIKYTYVGLTSIVFYSLVCTSVEGNQIWFFDGSVQCYSKWQVAMIVFGLTYVVPYPLLFGLGMKLIIQRRISKQGFFLACCFPLPLLVYWVLVVLKKQTVEVQTTDQEDEIEKVICNGIRGGFRESKHGTQYWEMILMFRRLFISMTILIPDPSIKLSVCFGLCLVCLLHHAFRFPFVHSTSNKAETLSLSLLCGIAAINQNKASFFYTDINPDSHQMKVMRNLELFETLCVMLLILFIVSCETAGRLGNVVHKIVMKKTQVIDVSSAVQPNI